MKKISMILPFLAFLCVTAFAQQKGSFTDPRDGKTYKTVKIGKQTWMAENLDYAASDSKCYKNEILYCDRYGRLYSWETAMVVCPKGWHLPSNAEWGILKKRACSSAGGCQYANKLLKATFGWNYDLNGTDAFGFAALPGGFSFADGYGYDGYFDNAGDTGGWWSASDRTAADYTIGNDIFYLGRGERGKIPVLYSVRCLKN